MIPREPTGPDFEPGGRLYSGDNYKVLVWGLTKSMDEVIVYPRMFNTIISIGPAGVPWYRDHW